MARRRLGKAKLPCGCMPFSQFELEKQNELGEVGQSVDVWREWRGCCLLISVDPNAARKAPLLNGRFCIDRQIIPHIQAVSWFLAQLARSPLKDCFSRFVYPHLLADRDLGLGNDAA